jgi:hypothetical protein
MARSRKSLYWMGAIAGGMLLLLCGLLLAATLFINLEDVHSEIISRIDRETGGRGSFQKVDISFLPRPHAVIYEGKLMLPNGQSVAFKDLTIYPKLLPLLRGDLIPSRIQCDSLRADIELGSMGESKSSGGSGPKTGAKSKMDRAIHTWAQKTDGLTIRIQNGFLTLSAEEGRKFQFSGINLSAENESGGLTLALTCAANLFGQMDLTGRMDLASLATKGTLKMSDLKAGELPEASRRHDLLRVDEGVLNLQADFEGILPRNLKAAVNLSAPSLGLSRGNRKANLVGVRITGDVRWAKDMLAVSLTHLTLDNPPMKLAGTFNNEKETPSVTLHLEGEELTVAALRSWALDFMGDVSTVREIFAVVRGGNVPSISVDAKGKTLADLGNVSAYTIQGSMRGGNISLTHPNLKLTEVEGSALISRGILSGQRLRAKLNKIEGKEGILIVPLEDGAAPFQLDIQVDADLAEAHSILKGVVTKGAFAKGLNNLRSIEGRVAARLRLDENKNGLSVDVDCSSCRLNARYGTVPLPLLVKQGRIHYRQNQVALGELTGSYGRSQFQIASGLLDWREEPRLNIAAATATLLLQEVHHLLFATQNSRTRLKPLKTIRGRVSVDSLALKGPLKTPDAWQYQTDFQVEDLFLDATFLPGPLKASKARLSANRDGISIDDVGIKILDTDVRSAAKVTGPLKKPRTFETTLSGTLGPQSMQYLIETLKIPHEFMLKTPLKVQSGRFLWNRESGASLAASTLFPGGPNVSVDMSYGPGKIDIRNLAITDREVKASFSMSAHEELVDLNFKGRLQKSTLDGILENNRILEGWIDGDISARVLPTQSFSTSAEGSLAGADIRLYGVKVPARIEDFSLHAEGQLLLVDGVQMVLGENRLTMSGNADLSTERPRFDVDIATKEVDLDRILAYLDKSKETSQKAKKKSDWHFPVRGTAHLMWDSLKLGGFTWQPFQGEITVKPESIRVAVENARLCGIDSPGVLHIKQDGTELNFRLKAEKSDLNQSITCLTHKRVSAEGTFDFSGKLSGKGNWGNLYEKTEGPLFFSSINGRVKQDPALAQVLSVLNLTDIFKGKLPSLEKDGLPYDLVQIKGKLKSGKIEIEKGLMNSAAMNLVFHGEVDPVKEQLDVTMLASPFTLTDRLIKMIPVVGYIMGGTLISVPVKVNGSLKDPKVRILPLSEIGSGTWGMLKRTLETPFRLVEPLVGEKETQKEKEDESTFW